MGQKQTGQISYNTAPVNPTKIIYMYICICITTTTTAENNKKTKTVWKLCRRKRELQNRLNAKTDIVSNRKMVYYDHFGFHMEQFINSIVGVQARVHTIRPRCIRGQIYVYSYTICCWCMKWCVCVCGMVYCRRETAGA